MISPISPTGSSRTRSKLSIGPSVISMIFSVIPGKRRPTQVPAPRRVCSAVSSLTSRPEIEATGSDAEQALEALVKLVENNFAEDKTVDQGQAS